MRSFLLAFSTLATWTTSLASLMFSFIDRWFLDPVAQQPLFECAQHDFPRNGLHRRGLPHLPLRDALHFAGSGEASG